METTQLTSSYIIEEQSNPWCNHMHPIRVHVPNSYMRWKKKKISAVYKKLKVYTGEGPWLGSLNICIYNMTGGDELCISIYLTRR